jgi:hypothetical protein
MVRTLTQGEEAQMIRGLASQEQLLSQPWRMNNLYYIQDKAGKRVRYRNNWAQEKLFSGLHNRNLILKARQLGISTGVDIFLLDCAIANGGIECGITERSDFFAEDLFRRKVKFPYENLPKAMQQTLEPIVDNKNELQLSNGSRLTAGISLRAGTYQNLHVSEYGIVSVAHPDKANEIKTGSIETVPIDGFVFMEATGKGRAGEFYNYCQTAMKRAASSKPLSPLEFKFFFFSWFDCPEYVLDPSFVTIPAKLNKYFNDVEIKTKVKLAPEQRAWYAAKKQTLGDDILSEYPSTPDEAFEASNKGAYWADELMECRKEGRIGVVAYQPGLPVDTWWDLGQDDATSIWFTQTIGNELHFIDYTENHHKGFSHWRKVLDERGYKYGSHYAPHDIKVSEYSGKTRWEQALSDGIRFEIIQRVQDKMDSINAVRKLLRYCWFDESHCVEGITYLEAYRHQWDDKHATWLRDPYRGPETHAADAVQECAQGHVFGKRGMASGLSGRGAR